MKYPLPAIPNEKLYTEELTQEQQLTLKYIQGGKYTKEDEESLQNCIDFYNKCYPALKEIPLSSLTDDEILELKEYLRQVFNSILVIQNGIQFHFVFRVTVVKDDFLEDGKIKNPKYITYPSLDVIRKIGKYNRANSPESPVFYCSFEENVAVMETKPQKGDRIIISTWGNKTNKKFVTYPITNATLIDNEGLRKATLAFQRSMTNYHPLFVEIFYQLSSFIASEFVKSVESIHPDRCEYLYSSFFSDQLLNPGNGTAKPNHDCIIYPSVAWKHQCENLAIIGEIADNNLQLVQVREFEVEETYYDKELATNQMPAKLKLLRHSTYPNIQKEKIIWNDDKLD